MRSLARLVCGARCAQGVDRRRLRAGGPRQRGRGARGDRDPAMRHRQAVPEAAVERAATLLFVYEAGPCGYGLHRCLSRARACAAVVVAPLADSAPFGRSGQDRSARRKQLAKLHRAGELTAVCPDEAHEAMRDLVRARGCACTASARRQQLSGFLLRQAITTTAGAGPRCTAAGWRACASRSRRIRWCSRTPSRRSRAGDGTRDRLTAQIESLLPGWSLDPVVVALQALRGMALVNAVDLDRRTRRSDAIC